MYLQSPHHHPSSHLLTALINLLVESEEHFVLILDDYQMITQEQVHTTLAYLVEHLPAQLRIILSTRADPPLPLPAATGTPASTGSTHGPVALYRRGDRDLLPAGDGQPIA